MKQGKMIITKHKKSDPEAPIEEEFIKADSTLSSVPPETLARVTFGKKRVVNIGNYESYHIDVSISLPCIASESEIQKTFNKANAFVTARVDLEVSNIDSVTKNNAIDDATWTDTFADSDIAGTPETDEPYTLEDF